MPFSFSPFSSLLLVVSIVLFIVFSCVAGLGCSILRHLMWLLHSLPFLLDRRSLTWSCRPSSTFFLFFLLHLATLDVSILWRSACTVYSSVFCIFYSSSVSIIAVSYLLVGPGYYYMTPAPLNTTAYFPNAPSVVGPVLNSFLLPRLYIPRCAVTF
jgi:hypothetical protein